MFCTRQWVVQVKSQPPHETECYPWGCALARRGGTGPQSWNRFKKIADFHQCHQVESPGTQVTLPNLHKRSKAPGNTTARPIFWSQVMRGQEKMGSTAQSAAAFTPVILRAQLIHAFYRNTVLPELLQPPSYSTASVLFLHDGDNARVYHRDLFTQNIKIIQLEKKISLKVNCVKEPVVQAAKSWDKGSCLLPGITFPCTLYLGRYTVFLTLYTGSQSASVRSRT